MDQLNFRAPDDLHDAVEEYAAEHGVDRSEAARTLLAQGVEHERGTSELDRIRAEHERERAELERELEEKDARIDELRAELRAANRRIDDVNDVVEETRTLVRTQEREQMLEERIRAASIFRRAWWSIAGNPHARRAIREADAVEEESVDD